MNRSECIAPGIVQLKAENPSNFCAVRNQVDGKRFPIYHPGATLQYARFRNSCREAQVSLSTWQDPGSRHAWECTFSFRLGETLQHFAMKRAYKESLESSWARTP